MNSNDLNYYFYILKVVAVAIISACFLSAITTFLICSSFDELSESMGMMFIIGVLIWFIILLGIGKLFDLIENKEEFITIVKDELPMNMKKKSSYLHTGPMPTWAKKTRARGWRIKKYNSRDISGNIFY